MPAAPLRQPGGVILGARDDALDPVYSSGACSPPSRVASTTRGNASAPEQRAGRPDPTRGNLMNKWVLVALLVLQAHFAASYLVPLDEQAQRTFGGLLRWAWPWAIGDGGPLGRMTATGFPMAGFFIAVTSAALLILALLAIVGVWVPFAWWRVLAIAGAALSIVLMLLFFGVTKVLPIVTALLILGAGMGYLSPVLSR
jgi:hypothetical protein